MGSEGYVVDDPGEIARRVEAKLDEAPYTHLVFGGGNTTPSGFPAKKMYPYMERFARGVIDRFR